MPDAVIDLADVSVVRGGNRLLDGVDWRVEEGERWVVLGPNGAGKTTLLSVCAAQTHPTDGVAGLLGEVLGTVDVFELRPRIGLTSASLADRVPPHERVGDLVVSAAYAVLGRWRVLAKIALNDRVPADVKPPFGFSLVCQRHTLVVDQKQVEPHGDRARGAGRAILRARSRRGSKR